MHLFKKRPILAAVVITISTETLANRLSADGNQNVIALTQAKFSPKQAAATPCS